jgi:hypothetical protein
MSVYTVVFVGSTPLGGILIGAIASAMGVPAALVVGGATCVAVGLIGAFWLSRIRAHGRAAIGAARPATVTTDATTG